MTVFCYTKALLFDGLRIIMTHYRQILVQMSDDIATITLNRPDKKNALSFLMMDELIDAAKSIKNSGICGR